MVNDQGLVERADGRAGARHSVARSFGAATTTATSKAWARVSAIWGLSILSGCFLVEPTEVVSADAGDATADGGDDTATSDTEPADTTADTEPADTAVDTAVDTAADTTSDTEPTDTTSDTEPADTTVDTEPADTTIDTEPADTTIDTGVATRPTTLPFAVDSFWVPSGVMGDGETPGGIAVTEDACNGARAGEGQGACRQFTWRPGRVGWAGVFWQYPEANWGTLPGLAIPAGATEVTLWAWGATGGEEVKFLAGIGGAAADGFAAQSAVFTLTTTPTQYRVALPTATLPNELVGAFGWVSGDTGGASFFVDDIQWR